MFNLKQPCNDCPFRKGNSVAFLTRERLESIFDAPAFQCHKTVDYSGEDREGRAGDKPQQCAGLMAVLHRSGKPNQIMQVAERLGHLDPTTLDPKNEAYASLEDVLNDCDNSLY